MSCHVDWPWKGEIHYTLNPVGGDRFTVRNQAELTFQWDELHPPYVTPGKTAITHSNYAVSGVSGLIGTYSFKKLSQKKIYQIHRTLSSYLIGLGNGKNLIEFWTQRVSECDYQLPSDAIATENFHFKEALYFFFYNRSTAYAERRLIRLYSLRNTCSYLWFILQPKLLKLLSITRRDNSSTGLSDRLPDRIRIKKQSNAFSFPRYYEPRNSKSG